MHDKDSDSKKIDSALYTGGLGLGTTSQVLGLKKSALGIVLADLDLNSDVNGSDSDLKLDNPENWVPGANQRRISYDMQSWPKNVGSIEDNLDGSGQPTPTSPPKKQTKILFTNNWGETLQGSLIPGEEVRIVYDSDRLPGRDRRYGQRAWEIFAEVKYSENDTVHSPRLEGPDSNGMMTTILTIPPEATAFIIWFKHWGYYSGYSYDSNYEKNYRFPFNQIVFTDTWDEYVKGGLYPGGKFQVVYNALRLPWRDTGYLGMGQAWNIFAHAQFSDNGPVVQQMLKGPVLDDPTMTTVYDIPENAKKVVMWFYFTGYRSGTHYDSNHNMNYNFALSKNES